jgi:hypothetical protein
MSSLLPDGLNPSYRIYNVSFPSLNYNHYILNFTENIQDIDYKLLYNFKDEYNINHIDDFIESLIYNETIFYKYFLNHNTGIHRECDKDCKTNVICSIYTDEYKRDKCFKNEYRYINI